MFITILDMIVIYTFGGNVTNGLLLTDLRYKDVCEKRDKLGLREIDVI